MSDRTASVAPPLTHASTECGGTTATVYLSLGANLGDRRASIRCAVEQLATHPAISLDVRHDTAALYESDPIGCNEEQPPYLNTVVRARTTLTPAQLLAEAQRVEALLGRVRRRTNEARVIDIDLLLHGNTVLDSPELALPHPAMTRRRFVLEPLCDLAPDLRLPLANVTIEEARRSARRAHQDQGLERFADRNWYSA